MLRKMLKYDMRAFRRVAIALTIVSLLAAALGGAAMSISELYDNIEGYELITSSAGLLGIFCVISIIVVTVVLSFMPFVRFYKNLFTDEGYLTFTLPIRRQDILLSKTLSNFLSLLYAVVLLFASMIVMGVVGTLISPPLATPPSYDDPAVIEIHWILGYLVLILILSLVSLLFQICVVQLCITLGAVLVRRAKIIVAIAIYYGINMGLQFIAQFVAIFVTLFFGDSALNIFANLTIDQMHLMFYGLLILASLVVFIFALIFYNINKKVLLKKLNLS